ncbi:hypothetical protein J3Q64DRAFT_1862691 [Phycomyces blakesleeanus]|uniref:Fe2OG dioxygenase domain-containing protein n=1 Tax=Phycomyces blakesleeanus TaxID=4837 RepID=A0ABR3AJY0_PHYBL
MIVSFDLFGEITAEEKSALQERTQKFQHDQQCMIASLDHDPRKRTMAENRLIFHHKRHSQFTVPNRLRRLFSLEECNRILEGCKEMSCSDWNTARHSAFATTDIPIRNSRFDYLIDQVRDRLIPVMANHYGFHPTRDLEFRDIFVVKYSADAQAGLKLHTDGCLLSFNVLINPKDEFDGGGTYFQPTDQTMASEQGDCVFHGAHIMHRGVDITEARGICWSGLLTLLIQLKKDGTGSIKRI